jgi:hypothetical protein
VPRCLWLSWGCQRYLRKSLRYAIRSLVFPSIQGLFRAPGSNSILQFLPDSEHPMATNPPAQPLVKRGTHKAAHVVITVPDPDNKSIGSSAEIGGRIEWRCDTPNYPTFDIVFSYPNPFNDQADYTVNGTIDSPVVLQPTAGGDYSYTVTQYPSDGSAPVNCGPIAFRVHPCTGCP